MLRDFPRLMLVRCDIFETEISQPVSRGLRLRRQDMLFLILRSRREDDRGTVDAVP